MAEAIKVGDVVRLKSGGPEMTVNDRMGVLVICIWFAGDEPRTETFSSDALELVRAA